MAGERGNPIVTELEVARESAGVKPWDTKRGQDLLIGDGVAKGQGGRCASKGVMAMAMAMAMDGQFWRAVG